MTDNDADAMKEAFLRTVQEPGESDFLDTERYGQVPAEFANSVAEIVQRNFPNQRVRVSQRYGIAQAVWNLMKDIQLAADKDNRRIVPIPDHLKRFRKEY